MPRRVRADETAPKSYVDFEAMVLQTFVQSMMPKEAEDVYGEGMAGDMWKSMMSQQLGTVMADRGGIGIADSLLKGHYLEGDTKVALSGVSSGPEKDRLDQERSLSTALVQEMQRRLTSDIAGETTPSMDRCNRNPTTEDAMLEYTQFNGEPSGREPVPMPARPASLSTIIDRIEQAVDEETASIRTDMNYDLKASNARKSRYLYELSRAMKGVGAAQLIAEQREAIVRLRDKLARNEVRHPRPSQRGQRGGDADPERHPALGDGRHLFGRRVRHRR